MKKHMNTTIYFLLVMIVFSCKDNTKKENNTNCCEGSNKFKRK